MSRSEPTADPAEYRRGLDSRPVPSGFRWATGSLGFVPGERPSARPLTMRLSMIAIDAEAARAPASALVTTRNRFPGAPVLLARSREAGAIRGVVINNKVANVAAPGGLDDAQRLAAAAGRLAGYDEQQMLSISTGVIGWRLPVDALESAIGELALGSASPREVAEAIMTTDRYPKLVSVTRNGATVLGIAKGAGMVEPNMATMLAFIVTDLEVDGPALQRALHAVVPETFNAISVDGDQSTSDMVVALASGSSGVSVDDDTLAQMLREVCDPLALEIVRNGEGTAHVIDVAVANAPTETLARAVARHVANSPLVKTAIYGNDPNVGRLLAATGHALDAAGAPADLDLRAARISLFGTVVYADGAFHLDGSVETRLAEALLACSMDPTVRGAPQDRGVVPIAIDLAAGTAGARVRGSDLSSEYVRENADYRS